MPKDIDIEDEKFEALLEQRRHNELKGLLVKLATAMSGKDDSVIVDAINGQGSKIGELVTAIQNMPKHEKQEKPQVNVELNPKDFVASVQELCKEIVGSNNKVIEALENRLLPDTFTLVKSYGGATESVKVNYKEANKLSIKK